MRFLPVKILPYYIIREHISPFFMSLGIIIFLFILNVIMKMMTKFVGKDIDLLVIVEYFYYSMGFILVLAVPMAMLVASLMVYSRFAQDNEFSVMQSSGISMWQLIYPTIIISGLLTVFMLRFHNQILPEMNHKNKILRQSISKKKPLTNIDAGIFNHDIQGYSIKAEKVNHITNKMYKVVVIENSRTANYRRTITADSGRVYYDSKSERYNIELFDGQIANLDTGKPEGYNRGFFRRMIMVQEVKGVDFEVQENNYYGDRELSADSLKAKILRLRGKGLPKKIIWQVEVEYHKKYALSYACIFLAMIGAGLGLMSGKGGAGPSATISIVLFTIYWVFLMMGEDLADVGTLHPVLAMWNGNIFIFLLGVFTLHQASKGTRINYGIFLVFKDYILHKLRIKK